MEDAEQLHPYRDDAGQPQIIKQRAKASYDEEDIYIVASHVTTSTLLLIANFLGGQKLIRERKILLCLQPS